MEENLTKNSKAEIGEQLFREGYNCAQALVGAFADELGMDFDTAMRVSAAFGGGMGRLRETCGTVTGAFMVLGLKLGYSDPKANDGKARLYALVQEFAARFKAENGSITCRELLGLRQQGASEPNPEARTEKYYACRPCVKLVGYAATLLEQMLHENGL